MCERDGLSRCLCLPVKLILRLNKISDLRELDSQAEIRARMRGMAIPILEAERAYMAKLGKRGGKARAKKLSKARIKEIATMGGKARAARRAS
jgi:hypothetical protein